MARQIAVLALLLIALVGLVSAANDAPKSTAATTEPSPGASGGGRSEAAAAPSNADDTIGNTDEAGAPSKSTGDGAAVEGPLGSEETAKSAAGAAQPPTSGATTLGVSVVSATAAVAGYFVF
ncbi:hypothetical protein REPUB_Repub01dG0082700 [Reevesia pubescens]